MPRLNRLVLPMFFALVFVASSVSALSADVDPAAATRTHDKAIQTPFGKFVQDLGDRAIGIIADKKMPPDERSAAFGKILSDDFDLRTVGRFVIGRTWNEASPEQQAEYMDLFKSLVIRSYGSRMALYTGEGFEVVGTRRNRTWTRLC